MSQLIGLMQSLIGKKFDQSPSPFGRWLNGTVKAAELGSLTFRFDIRDEMKNPAGALHGGVIAGMMDDIIGATVMSSEIYSRFASLNLNLEYLAPVLSNQTHIDCRTEVVKQGKRTCSISCTVTDNDGQLIAKGNSIVMNLVSV